MPLLLHVEVARSRDSGAGRSGTDRGAKHSTVWPPVSLMSGQTIMYLCRSRGVCGKVCQQQLFVRRLIQALGYLRQEPGGSACCDWNAGAPHGAGWLSTMLSKRATPLGSWYVAIGMHWCAPHGAAHRPAGGTSDTSCAGWQLPLVAVLLELLLLLLLLLLCLVQVHALGRGLGLGLGLLSQQLGFQRFNLDLRATRLASAAGAGMGFAEADALPTRLHLRVPKGGLILSDDLVHAGLTTPGWLSTMLSERATPLGSWERFKGLDDATQTWTK